MQTGIEYYERDVIIVTSIREEVGEAPLMGAALRNYVDELMRDGNYTIVSVIPRDTILNEDSMEPRIITEEERVADPRREWAAPFNG